MQSSFNASSSSSSQLQVAMASAGPFQTLAAVAAATASNNGFATNPTMTMAATGTVAASNEDQSPCDVGVAAAFIKFENGRWWPVEESVYRERIGSLIRDRLHGQFKSSNKSKRALKRRSLHQRAQAANAITPPTNAQSETQEQQQR